MYASPRVCDGPGRRCDDGMHYVSGIAGLETVGTYALSSSQVLSSESIVGGLRVPIPRCELESDLHCTGSSAVFLACRLAAGVLPTVSSSSNLPEPTPAPRRSRHCAGTPLTSGCQQSLVSLSSLERAAPGTLMQRSCWVPPSCTSTVQPSSWVGLSDIHTVRSRSVPPAYSRVHSAM